MTNKHTQLNRLLPRRKSGSITVQFRGKKFFRRKISKCNDENVFQGKYIFKHLQMIQTQLNARFEKTELIVKRLDLVYEKGHLWLKNSIFQN